MEIVTGLLNLKSENNEVSILRTANHFDIMKVFVIGEKLNHKEKTCTNCHRKMKIRYFKESWEFFNSIQSHGYKLILLEKTEDSQDIRNFKFPDKFVLMTGHESKGFSEEFLNNADAVIHIPTLGNQVRCLNTATAFAIGLWEAIKQDGIKT